MPTPDEILGGLLTIANSWKPIAVLWHAYFAFLAGALLLGWRPSARQVGALLIPPIASVSLLAWIGGNPFNGSAFVLLSLVLALLLPGVPTGQARVAELPWSVLGGLLFAFAWVYPHFLDAEPGYAYLYAAPLGLIPCPTLSMAVGIALVFRGLDSRAWSVALIAAAVFYGVFGSLYLGVGIDWILAGGGLCLLVFLLRKRAPTPAATA